LEFNFGGDEEAMAMSSKIVFCKPRYYRYQLWLSSKKSCLQRRWCWSFEDVDLMIRLTKAVIDSTHLPVTVKPV
jgi:hypothetical protein